VVNRRELRKSLGTRRTRREGTKTKAIPGMTRPNKPTPQFRNPLPRRNGRVRPRVLLERLIRALT